MAETTNDAQQATNEINPNVIADPTAAAALRARSVDQSNTSLVHSGVHPVKRSAAEAADADGYETHQLAPAGQSAEVPAINPETALAAQQGAEQAVQPDAAPVEPKKGS